MVILAAAVLLAGGFAWWWARRGGDAAKPNALDSRGGSLIAEATPSISASTDKEPTGHQKAGGNLTERERRLKYYRDRYGDNLPENLKPVVYFLEHPPQKTFSMRGEHHFLRHPSERQIAGVVLQEPGTFFLQRPEFGETFDKDFLNAFADKIEIHDDDPDEVKRVKEDVEAVKKEIADICRRKGMTPSEVMNEQSAAMFELGRYQRDLEQELDRMHDDTELTDEEVGDFCKAANELLAKKGLKPLPLPDLTRRSIRLAHNARIAAKKAARENRKEETAR